MVERLIVMVVLIVVVGVYISPHSPCARPPPFCRCLARSPYSNDPLFVNPPLSVGRFLAGLNLAGLINSCARFVGVVDTDREPYQASTNRLLCTCTHTTSTTKRDQWVRPPADPLRHRQRRGPLRGRPVRCPLFCRLSCRHQYRPPRVPTLTPTDFPTHTPTGFPTHTPTGFPTILRHPNHEFNFRGCSDFFPTPDTGFEGAGVEAAAVNGASCTVDGMTFDGIDDFVRMTPSKFGGEPMTIEAYVKYDDDTLNGETSWILDISDSDGAGDDGGGVFVVNRGGTCEVGMGIEETLNSSSSSSSLSSSSAFFERGEWIHLVATLEFPSPSPYISSAPST